jgi:hypothetical protein
MVKPPFGEQTMPEHPEFSEGEGLLRGARRIARYIYGREPTREETRSVYSMVRDLPIFHLAGMLAARPNSLARAISAREQAQAPAVAEPAKRKSPPKQKRRR